MLLFFYLFTFAINLWHWKFVTADITPVFVNNQHGIQRQGQDFAKKSLYVKRYTANRLTDEFPKKSLTKRGVKKLLKKLRDTGTVNRQPGSGRLRSARNEENVETVNDLVLSQEDKLQTHRTVHEISRETGIRQCIENAICLYILPYLLNICRKFEFLISEGTCLRRGG